MVMDFGDLKKIVKEEIVEKLDHAIVLNQKVKNQQLLNIPQMFDRMYFVPFQPTCENLLLDFAKKIKARLPENITLYRLKLNETANSYAEWYASDNI